MTKLPKHIPEDAIEVGRIKGAWGIKGSLRIASYSAESDALFTSDQWYLLPAENRFAPQAARQIKRNSTQSVSLPRNFPVQALQIPQILTIKDLREQGDSIKVDAVEVTDRNMAEAMKGMRIFVSREDFPELDDDEFYWVDLIGLNVINKQGENLGVVTGLLDNGAQSVLQINYKMTDEEGGLQEAERLIPFVDAFVGEVDFEKNVIHVDWQSDY